MPWSPEEMAVRLAADIHAGWIVNLGTGMSTAVAGHLRGRAVLVESENGILGVGGAAPAGAEDVDIVDAGKNSVTVVAGAAFMDSAVSFSIIRGGYIDISVMGAYQVSQGGDLANWRRPGQKVAGVGGAADLAVGAQRVWVLMTHTSKKGEPKIVRECDFPVTARSVVTRVYTDLAVLEPQRQGFRVLSLAPDVGPDDVQAATGAPVQQQVAQGEA